MIPFGIHQWLTAYFPGAVRVVAPLRKPSRNGRAARPQLRRTPRAAALPIH